MRNMIRRKIPICWQLLCIALLIFCLNIDKAFAITTVKVISGIANVDPNTSSTSNEYDSHWQYWSQGASKYLNGTDSTKLRNMPQYGCRVVAQSKLLVEAGLASPNVSIFNPDLYFEWTVSNGYQKKSPLEIGTIGQAVIDWGDARGTEITCTVESYTGIDQVMAHIRAGQYVIMSCDKHQAYIGRQASLNYGSPVVLDSGGWTSCNPALAVALSGYGSGRVSFNTIYIYTIGEIIPPGKPQPAVTATDNLHAVKFSWTTTANTDSYGIRIYDSNSNIVYWRDNYTKTGFAAFLEAGNYQVEICSVLTGIAVTESERVSFTVSSALPTHNLNAVSSKASSGKLFKLYNTNTTWLENRKLVENVGGRLAVIDSQAKQNCIYEMVHAYNGVVYLGAQGYSSYDWLWLDGSVVGGYTNWDSGKPDNYQGYENCMIMIPSNGLWDDYSNDETIGCVAEFDPVSLKVEAKGGSIWQYDETSVRNSLNVIATFTDGSSCSVTDYGLRFETSGENVTVYVTYGALTTCYSGRAGVPQPTVTASDNLHMVKIFWDATPYTDEYSIRIYDTNESIVYWRDHYTKTSFAALLDPGSYQLVIAAVKSNTGVIESQQIGFSVTSASPSHQLYAVDSRLLNGKLYKLFNTQTTWLENKKLVENAHGRLAIVDSQTKQDCIYEMVHDIGQFIFIGAQGYTNYDWMWVNSSKVEGYTNWEPYRPDNYEGYENCMIMYPNNGHWDDVTNDRAFGCVAEFDLVNLEIYPIVYSRFNSADNMKGNIKVVATFADGSYYDINDYDYTTSGGSGTVTVNVTYGGISESCTLSESKGYILPNDPAVIGEGRFILPDNLTVIEEEAFANVSGRYFVVPDSVIRIGRNAFPANAVVYLNLSKINLPLDAIAQRGIYVDNGSTPNMVFAEAAEDSPYIVLNIHGDDD